MSNALAIAAVSAVVKHLLENSLVRQNVANSLGETPTITLLAPNPDDANAAAQSKDRLNLFLYQTSLNQGWRNVGLPTRDSRGDRLTNPPLAVDLHYLMTAYSREAFHAEIMLGYGMQAIHETPVLTREMIRTALRSLAAKPNPADRALAASDLADQIEQLKISLMPMATEELSKLWSAFQTQYRPSIPYLISVVLIESNRSTRSALPVRDRNLIAFPFKPPVIESVTPQVVNVGEPLTLQGYNLSAALVRITVTNETLAPNPANVTDTAIHLTVPNTLPAGVNTVQVAHLIDFQTRSPSEPHRGVESNTVAFMVAPRITSPPPVMAGSSLTLNVDPPVRANQKVALIIADRALSVPKISTTSATIAVPIPADFPKGTYLLRLRIDGAESFLEVDKTPESDTFNQYIGPSITIM